MKHQVLIHILMIWAIKGGKTSSEISQIINPRIQRSVFFVRIHLFWCTRFRDIAYSTVLKMLRAIKYNKENKNE